MKKYSFVIVILVVLLLIVVLPISAASWSNKVTGGGQAAAGGVDFSITTSAWNDGNGHVGGQMQYSRYDQTLPDLSMHGKVECFNVFEDGAVAVAAGPAKAQYDPGGAVGSDDWMVVEIREGGIGAGDEVRVRLMSDSDVQDVCDSPSGIFPGLVYDGNFSIRSK
jgi:hypothetical protein